MRGPKSGGRKAAKPVRGATPRSAADPPRRSRAKTKKPPKKTKVQARRRSPDPKAATLAWHPGPPIDSEAALRAGIAGLRERDAAFVDRVFAITGMPPLRIRPPGLEGLTWIIVSQQLSTASASAIFARFRALFPAMDAGTILTASEATLRGCGLSGPKIRTLRSLCGTIVEGHLDLAALANVDAAEAHRALVAVNGIGPWTADIFLLSCLGHPDAWPAGDLALQEAARLALGLKLRPNTAELHAIGESWRPWRAVAARLLWSYYRAIKGREGMSPAT